MKKIFLPLMFLATSFTYAQTAITLTRADFPCPSAASCGLPDSVLYTNLPLTSTVNTTLTGANSNWDMSTLTGGTLAYQKFSPMSATPLVFQLAFLTCDYVQPLLGNAAVGAFPVTDAYEYYNYAGTGSNRLEIKGFGAYVTIPGSTTPVPLPAIYSSPDVVYKFPLTFGNIDSSNSGYSLTLPLPAPIGDVTFKRNQKRVNEVDGWGSISTPAGSFSVLRVKSSITRVDSFITGIFPIGFPSNPVEFKWLGSTKKIPVFQVLGADFLGTFTPTTISYWGEAKNTGFEELNSSSSLQVYPNPTLDNSTVEYTLNSISDIDILINTLDGKLVGEFHFKNQQEGKHREILPLQSLSAGTYVIKCVSNKQVILSKVVKW